VLLSESFDCALQIPLSFQFATVL